jgi:hypothetical protein
MRSGISSGRSRKSASEPGASVAAASPSFFFRPALGDGQPAALLDPRQSERAVARGPVQNHADRPVALVFGQRNKEAVDRAAKAGLLLRRSDLETVAVDRQQQIRLEQIEPAAFHGRLVPDLRQLMAGEHLLQPRRIQRLPVLKNDDDRDVVSRGERAHEFLDRIGRGAGCAERDHDRPTRDSARIVRSMPACALALVCVRHVTHALGAEKTVKAPRGIRILSA